MLEVIIVITIVAVVAAMAVRSFHRTMTGKNDSCGGCPGACAGCLRMEAFGEKHDPAPRKQDDDVGGTP